MAVAQLVWFDTGASTGMAVVGIRPRWLLGSGDPGYDGLGSALALRWVGQVGTDARIWSAAEGRSRRPSGHVVDGAAWMDRRKARAGSDTLDRERANILNVTSEAVALLENWPDAAWGHESFTLMPTVGRVTSDTLSAAAVYDGITFAELAYGEMVRVPFTQSASFAKTTVDDAKLKAAGCYYPGMRHANDAMRHALLFAREARKKADLRAAAWPKIFRDDGTLRP